MKIVAIGVGSGFGRGTLADVLGSPEFSDLDCTLVLVDTNEEALERMHRLALLLKEYFGSRVRLERTTDRRDALRGAGYVITSVAIKRYPLWEQDFRIPMAFGFKQALGENGGPGAMFHALRNFELMMPIARDMEELCPDALLLNYTNPEARIIMAISKLTRLRSVGLCHGVMGARDGISLILDRPLEELDITAGGINHFFWVMKIADAKTGEDLYPALRKRILEDPSCPAAPPLIKKMVELFGCYTYPSDDHIGEYLSFGAEFTGLLWHYGIEARPVPRTTPGPTAGRWEEYASGARPIDESAARPSGELAASIILDIELDRGEWRPAVNVPNTQRYIENLPEDAVVEVAAVVDKGGVHPQPIGKLPEALAEYCRRQVTIQKLLVEAYAQRSRNLLLQTLLLDPVVDNVAGAERMLDHMLTVQGEYLPEFV